MNIPITLTGAQQELVEHYLSVVNWVITDHIKLNPQVCGLEYSDVYQEGCLYLCRAAASYTGSPDGFGAYARKVVRNGLLSYCRQICRQAAPLPCSRRYLRPRLPLRKPGPGWSRLSWTSSPERSFSRRSTKYMPAPQGWFAWGLRQWNCGPRG